MKTNTTRFFEASLWLIQLVPVIFLAYTWNSYPDRVPTHWNISGEPDNWGGKWALFIGPGAGLLAYLLLLFIPRLDPKRGNYLLFSKSWHALRLILQLFLMFISLTVLAATLNSKVDVGMLVQMGVLVLLLLLGNYMNNIRHNYFFGVRTPWTLASEEVWKLTHRFTSRLWVFATLPMFIVTLLWPKAGWPMFTYIGIISIIPIVYSYILFRRTKTSD